MSSLLCKSWYALWCSRKKIDFIRLWLNYRCHMDEFNNVLTTFLGLKRFSYIAVYAESESSWFHQKYLNLCSEDEQRSCGFGMTWGWVINDRIFIFRWIMSLSALWRQWRRTCTHQSLLITPAWKLNLWHVTRWSFSIICECESVAFTAKTERGWIIFE